LVHLKVRILMGGRGVEVVSSAVKEGMRGKIERAVEGRMEREGGLFTGLSLVRFALEMRPSLRNPRDRLGRMKRIEHSG